MDRTDVAVDEIKKVAGIFGLGESELLRAIGELRSLNGSAAQSPTAGRKLKALRRAYTSLQAILPDEATIQHWIRRPIQRLGGLTPLALLEQHGLKRFIALVGEFTGDSYA